MKSITLYNGVDMPVLGLGVFQMTEEKECEEIVLEALKQGYRLIDTAASYGNEEAVGRAIKRSQLPREDLFITTKLWLSDATYEGTKDAFARSSDKLELDYLDLYMIHQPFHDIHGAWRAMEELYHEGKIRALGVANFTPDRLVDLMAFNEIMPAVNQIEHHLFHQRNEDINFLQKKGIYMQGWAPFAEGKHHLFQNETLQLIGDRYGKSIAQIILRWHIQRGIGAIPKTVNVSRLKENIDVFDFELSSEEMALLSKMDTQTSSFFDHRDPESVNRLVHLVRKT